MKIIFGLTLVCLLYGCYKVYGFVTADFVIVKDIYGWDHVLSSDLPGQKGFKRFCETEKLGVAMLPPPKFGKFARPDGYRYIPPCTNHTIFFEVLDMIYRAFANSFTLGMLALFIGRLGYGYYHKRQAENNQRAAVR